MSSSGSSSNTYALGKDNKPSMRYVAVNTQMTQEGERSKLYSEPWTTSGNNAPPSSEQLPWESSSYSDQKQMLSTWSPSSQHFTSSLQQNRPNSTLTKTPSSPHGQRNLPTTHTSSCNSKLSVTAPLQNTNELVAWKQLPRDRGGVTISTNFHFPPSYNLPGIPEIPENSEDYEQ